MEPTENKLIGPNEMHEETSKSSPINALNQPCEQMEVATYTVSVPLQKLEFNSVANRDWLQHEIEGVYTKGLSLFTQIEKYLKKVESGFSGSDLVLGNSSKTFDEIMDMLSLERSEFEEKIKNYSIHNDESGKSGGTLLRLNQLRWEILLEACVWDHRLQLLPNKADKNTPEALAATTSQNPEGSIESAWTPFGKIREECMKDLQGGSIPKFGHLPKFEVLVNSEEISSMVSQMIMEESSRGHIPSKSVDYFVSDYDGEISSSVACALASWNKLNPDTNSMPSDFPLSDFSEPLVAQGPMHPEVNLGTEKYLYLHKGKCSVVIFYAEQFRNLRKVCCPSELDYIASLSRCETWDPKDGKSKSVFGKTLDDRFVIKEIRKTECNSFMKFANHYFEYLKQSFKSGDPTCLAKILGIYQVTVRHPQSGKETKHDIMVQENLLFGKTITHQYDLKGDVQLDQGFVNDMNSSPLYISQNHKRLLYQAVWNDSSFLTSANVMDYSLSVGVDKQQKELVCGIINYLRQYTWDKQLETWVKTALVRPKTKTITSPKEYKKRFRKFVDSQFLAVPDDC